MTQKQTAEWITQMRSAIFQPKKRRWISGVGNTVTRWNFPVLSKSSGMNGVSIASGHATSKRGTIEKVIPREVVALE